jgi:hypothetical protein
MMEIPVPFPPAPRSLVFLADSAFLTNFFLSSSLVTFIWPSSIVFVVYSPVVFVPALVSHSSLCCPFVLADHRNAAL